MTDTLTASEAALLYDCHRITVIRACRAGRIPGAFKDRYGYWQIPADSQILPAKSKGGWHDQERNKR